MSAPAQQFIFDLTQLQSGNHIMSSLTELFQALQQERIVPYLGPGILGLNGGDAVVPATPEALAAYLSARVTVPYKIRNRLTAAAQYIENFKHRKTLVTHMGGAFLAQPDAEALRRLLTGLSLPPLIVSVWYDDTVLRALAAHGDWGMVQGWSQAEHFGEWYGYYRPDGTPADEAQARQWSMLVYQPVGCVRPVGNYLVSDSDYVEVLTEIDIQTPIPPRVQQLRSGREFLFIGCRFSDQLSRSFARQIMKRSGERHWMLLTETPTRNELRFLQEQHIRVIPMTLQDFASQLVRAQSEPAAA